MKKVVLFLLAFVCVFTLASCNETEEDNQTPDLPSQNVPTPLPNETIDGYTFEGTRTVAPYTVYNADGSVYESADKEEANPNNSLFNAIRLAGAKSVNSNKMYVLDANGLEVFKRQSKSECWCFDGTYFVGVKKRADAIEWSEGRKRSYVIDGQGLAYVTAGIVYYEGSDVQSMDPKSLEYFSGGYNYMFTTSGVPVNSTDWDPLGFGYMETYCRLSEASYLPNQDTQNRSDDAWNAYIFINGGAGKSCDLGLIGSLKGNQVVWALVRNCQHSDHNTNQSQYGPSFTVLGWEPVTTMTWDEDAGCYNGADDLFFQCWQGVDGWILKITNLRTNQVFTIDERHEGMFAGSEQYFRFLLAASYCPVVDDVWNARCGAFLRNVVFDGNKVSRYVASEFEYEKDFSQSLLDFYPGENMIYGYSQASDCASAIYGVRTENGTYASGNTYNAGDKYISFSSYYDGGSH